MSRAKPWLRELLRFLVYGLIGIAIVLAFVRSNGYKVAFREVEARKTSPYRPVDFTTDGAEPRLVHDFEPDAVPRNVVLFVGDGLGFAQLLAARAELVGLNRRLAIERMPMTGWIHTHARTSLGTDSAAGATALATGQKVKPGRLSLHTDGRSFRTLAEAARDDGLAVGVVTDSYLWDATSGAFLVHLPKRGMYSDVARQMAASGAEFLAGTLTGRPLADYGEAAAVGDLEAGGFAVARFWHDVENLPSEGPLALLFDYKSIAARHLETDLFEIATLGLDRLATDPEGFFMVIETEETDTGSHHHDFQRVMAGIDTFDKTVAHVLELAQRDRETLVLLTADHETGGLSLHNASPGGTLEVEWATFGHTAAPVPFFAYGPGAQRFVGALDNTEPARILADLMGWGIGDATENPADPEAAEGPVGDDDGGSPEAPEAD